MSTTSQIRNRLKQLGVKTEYNEKDDTYGIELTVCQVIVVLMSMVAIVFMFLPSFFLQNPIFMGIFFGISMISILVGMWFWTKKHEICEKPEDYRD